jgi:hypothetical protein
MTDSPALREQSAHYPAAWNGRVPKRVRMLCYVCPDAPVDIFDERGSFWPSDIADCVVNKHGAVSAVRTTGDLLGVKPSEFEVVEWHEQPETKGPTEQEAVRQQQRQRRRGERLSDRPPDDRQAKVARDLGRGPG